MAKLYDHKDVHVHVAIFQKSIPENVSSMPHFGVSLTTGTVEDKISCYEKNATLNNNHR